MKRSYHSTVREDSARRTKGRIAAAARERFLADGYSATSVAAVAAAAGVTSQTVYNVFGTKAALLKHVYDVTLVGDDEPVPFADRPEVRAAYATEDQRELVLAYARLGLTLQQRLGALVQMIQAGAAGGDPDLVSHLDTIGREHYVGVSMLVERLRQLGPLRCSVEEARDVAWTLTETPVWDLLVRRRGWTPERYADWVGCTLADAILGPPGAGPQPTVSPPRPAAADPG